MAAIKEFKAGKMSVKAYETRKEMGAAAASEAAAKIKEMLASKSEINIIFAAAPSQNEFLEALAADKSIPWEKINAFHMDEYTKLDKDAPQGFANFLRARIFDVVPFKSVNTLNGNNPDLENECKRYSELLTKYPTDITCMGIGENGHIAFNDPHVAHFDDDKLVKVVDLDDKCRQQQVNDGCFDSFDKVPTHALTLTIPALTKSDCIFCIVPAKTKADAVYKTVNGEIREMVPASILRIHKNASLYIDKDSASKL